MWSVHFDPIRDFVSKMWRLINKTTTPPSLEKGKDIRSPESGKGTRHLRRRTQEIRKCSALTVLDGDLSPDAAFSFVLFTPHIPRMVWPKPCSQASAVLWSSRCLVRLEHKRLFGVGG